MTQRDPLHAPGVFSAVSVFNLFGQEEKAQALIDRFRSYKPNNVQLLVTDSMHHLYSGKSAEGLRLAEQAYQLAPTDEVMQAWVTIGLLQTLQLERVAEEGVDGFKIDALDVLGRRDEAFELAVELSREGFPEDLFVLYNRADRSRELIDHLEERWPSLDSFAADYPQDEFGYGVMAEIALAYSRTGRKLVTNHSDDIQFDLDRVYRFGVSRYEIAGRKRNPKLEQPWFGAGEITGPLTLKFVRQAVANR